MKLTSFLGLSLSFVAGGLVTTLSGHFSTQAQAESAPLVASLIDVTALKDADLMPTANPDLRTKTFVATDNATIGIQMGNVGKHFHSQSDEIQYIVEGSGTAWLGNQQVAIKPGMLLIIPKGTPHGGTEAISGRFKAIAIKIPPQVSGDTHFM